MTSRDNSPNKATAFARLRQLLPADVAERAIQEIETEGAAAIRRWLSDPREPPDDMPASSRSIVLEAREEEGVDASTCGRIGYMTRAIIMATLPHGKPKSLEFRRKSGNYTLLMHVPQELARDTGVTLPYGPMPRLIFLWMTTEVKRSRERDLHLGGSRSAFLRKLMLEPRTGKRGNMRMLEHQLKSLLATTFSAWSMVGEQEGRGSLRLHHRQLASDAALWWNADEGRDLEAIIRIDSEFYREMVQGGIPVNLHTVQRFKENSLALDIYVWLTYRFSTLRTPRIVPWEYLMEQFGSEYGGPNGPRAFRDYFKRQLRRVIEAYPDAHVAPNRAGLQLFPSPTHIRPVQQ